MRSVFMDDKNCVFFRYNHGYFRAEEIEWIGHTTEISSPFLQTAPLRDSIVHQISKFLEVGSLPDNWYETLPELSDVLGEKVDILLYPSQKTLEEATAIFERLVYAIALLSFVPGGIRIFGMHYQSWFGGVENGCSKA